MEAYQAFEFSYLTNIEETPLLKRAEKVEQVRDMLMKMEQDSLESLELVDAIQRFGLCYHFKDEIQAILHHQYLAHKTNGCEGLFEASLRFRLLRQHGCQVIADDFFGQFLRDGELKVRGSLVGETMGVVAMHEASHLNMGGEDILYEAAKLSSQWLNREAVTRHDEEFTKMVNHCLSNPQHKTVAGFAARNIYLQFENAGKNHALRELADLEFAYIDQSLHKHEILRVVEWWNGVRVSEEVKSSRNQPLKWHVWSMAIIRNPSWSKHRILLTKPISLVYAVDDIFDLHGTIHDLTHFTQAVKRWDVSASDELPSYMKTWCNAIYNTTDEISSFIYREHGWDPIHFLKKEWGNLMDAFLVEAKWLRSGELVKAEEYLKNGVISSGVPMVLSHLFFLMGNPLTNQTHILLNDPNGLTHSVAKLLRLHDDFGSAKDEKQNGYDGSYIECYIKEGKAESWEGAREHVMNIVEETWENINKHALSCSSPTFSPCFARACLNAARMVPTMYSYGQDHSLPLLQHYVRSMFRDPTFAKSLLG